MLPQTADALLPRPLPAHGETAVDGTGPVCGTGVDKTGRDVRSESIVHLFIAFACLVFAGLSETVLIVMTFLGFCVVFIPELQSSFKRRHIVNRVSANLDGITLAISSSAHFCANWQNVTESVPWSHVRSIDLAAPDANPADADAAVVFKLFQRTRFGRQLAVDVSSHQDAVHCINTLRALQEFVRLSEPPGEVPLQ